MRNQYQLIAIALLAWMVFGGIVLTPGAYFILNYGLIQNAVVFGTVLGAVIGLIVGVIAAAPSINANRVSAFYWILAGSMVGAIMGVVIMLRVGGFPTRSQADLSLVFLGPASLAVGAGLGMLFALIMWRVWQR